MTADADAHTDAATPYAGIIRHMHMHAKHLKEC